VETLLREGVDAAMNRYNGMAVEPANAAKESAESGVTGESVEDV